MTTITKGKEPSAITTTAEEPSAISTAMDNKKEEIDMYPKSQEGITWWPGVITKEEAATTPVSDEFIHKKTIEYVVQLATIGVDMIDKYFMEKNMAKLSVLSDDDDKDQTPSSPSSSASKN